MATTTAYVPFLEKPAPAHITLESLLDATGLTPPSPLSESVSNSLTTDIHSMPAMKCGIPVSYYTNPALYMTEQTTNSTENSLANEFQRQALLMDMCLELTSLLKDQDVNGYFLYPLPHSKYSRSTSQVLGLLDIEKQVFRKYYQSLSEFQKDILNLLTGAIRYYQVESMAYNEAHRLLNLSQDWFNSLNPEYITNLNRPQDNLLLAEKNSQVEVINNIDADLVSKETYLKILNPDNNGIINGTERVQSIGDEAGHLNSGSSLLPNGGYREDRRNKVIPYTYLDYGPYYSFAPTYDSGASHCTPESNQLLLGTTWLPARTPFVLGKRSLTGGYDIDGCMDDFEITDEVISTVLEMGDQQLAISLAVAENEQRAVTQLSSELEEIIPGPDVPDEFVFSICLANAFTRDLIKKRENLPITVSNESCSEAGPESEELKTVEKNEIAENVVEPSVVENISATCDLDSITHHDLVDSNACTHPYDDESNIDSSNSLNTELIKSAEDLNALYCAQYLRLGDTSQTVNLGSTLQPTSNEMAIAHRLTERFVKLAKYTRPQDLVHPYSVRKAMGLNPEEYFLPEDLTSGDNLNYCE